MIGTLRSRGTRLVAAVLVAALCLGVTGTAAGARDKPPPGQGEVQVLETGLNSPKGLSLFWGHPVIAQGAFALGPPPAEPTPGPVLIEITWGPWKGRTFELSAPIALVDVAVAKDLTIWGLGSDQKLYAKFLFGGEFEEIADIAAYQQTDPDPFNQTDDPTESNPYGLAVLPSGEALVTDAANNDLLRVNHAGDITTVARFGPEMISTDHLGDEAPPVPFINAEAVPTTVAVGNDGIYVGELKGFPFRPGSSNIYKIDFDAEGAVCDADAKSRSKGCRVALRGFTAIQDIAINRWSHTFYVYELAADGVLAFEAGFETGVFPPAVLLEVNKDKRRELAAGQLSQPGGVVSTWLTHEVYVTDGVFSDGRLLKVK